MGYYGLFLGLRYQNTQQLTQRLDADEYNESEAVMLKIPIAIPYAVDNHDFERVNGEFQHNGEFYRLVKQRLSNDTLYVVCIKDQESKRIDQAITDYVKTFADNPGNTSHSVNTLPNFIKDFVGNYFSIKPASVGWSQEVSNQGPSKILVSSFSVSIVHPPERG